MKASIASAVLAYLATVSAQGVTQKISAPGSAPASCATNQVGRFGIQIVSAPARVAKRQVTQIADGQIQATSAARPVSQIRDGQIQAATSTAAARPVTQIGDGQIQAATAVSAARVVTVTVTKNNCIASPITQIGDGQIQAPMATPVTQIADGQIQAATRAATATPVSQIRDGQIQAATSRATTGTPVSQIRDGQIQAATSRATTGTPVSQIRDGQIQANTGTTLSTTTRAAGSASTSTSSAGYAMLPGAAQACFSSGTLSVNLTNGVLLDSQGRTGYIAANSQFQFDAPAQTGAIYTAGWSLCSNGSLALGSATTFYQCLSGNFYNIYLNNVLGAAQCQPVQIEAIQLNSC